ncbi:hypothetical protein [Phnomibacter ginsenosidimutans]|uniref:Uncharacterized protein n=1 Tax=Phnomibacter ginsenosidimutans TaxID=2676868 RepID=A0A6I6G3T8_9BACT|nr:hypothetical protein [Phnomibacter ginsenosidimutans]QGW27256.1 hypothetical protein GLV81_03265 [Phnomibacter ginsenosidimutans]
MVDESPHPDAAALVRRFGRLKSMVEFTDTASMTGEELKEIIQKIRYQLWDFSAEFSRLFFSYT